MWVSEGRCVMVGVLREDKGRRWSQETASCCLWAAEGLRAGRGGVDGGREGFTWTGLTIYVNVLLGLLCWARHLG